MGAILPIALIQKPKSRVNPICAATVISTAMHSKTNRHELNAITELDTKVDGSWLSSTSDRCRLSHLSNKRESKFATLRTCNVAWKSRTYRFYVKNSMKGNYTLTSTSVIHQILYPGFRGPITADWSNSAISQSPTQVKKMLKIYVFIKCFFYYLFRKF